MSNLLPFPRRQSHMPPLTHDPVVAAHLHHLELLGQTVDTVATRRRALARMTRALGKPLLEATREDLAAWRAGLSVGPATIRAYVSHAREFYRWAMSEELLVSSPAVRLPSPRLPRRVPRPIGEQDLFAAMSGAPARIRPWLALAGWCGLRAREIARLRRECVLEQRAEPALLVDTGAAKGGTERLVPLHPFALAELLEAGLPQRGWVFRRADGQPGPNAPWIVSHLCNRWLHESGHPETLHQLRHRFATVTYQQSRDLRMVQGLLGHASPSTTASYADWDTAGAASVVNSIPAPGHLRVVSK